MNSIPASQLVNVIPGVLGAGGSPLSLNSLILTESTAVPIDATIGHTVLSFPTADAVGAYFGLSSEEKNIADIYFNGYSLASTLPGLLYFVQYNPAAVAAYLRSGSLAAMTLTQLQALSGTIICTVNGVSSTSLSINLASATSFSNAAALIQTGIQGGTPSSTATVTYDATLKAFVIKSSTTGAASTIGFATGTLAAGIKLQAAQGAITSQGADIAVPATVLNEVTRQTQNWALFMTTVEYATAVKVAFADWANTTNQRYAFVGWDTDVLPTQSASSPTSFGPLTSTYNGRIAVWGVAGSTGARAKAALFCAITASLDFDETNGRITYAFRSQSGMVPDVTDSTVAANLIANGYNFYGSYATANDQFQFLQNGQISGSWKWVDAYVNQIKLNSDLQLAFVTLLNQVKSVPYVTRGYDLLRAAALDPINAAINFGSIVAGVNLSASQRAQVNTAAGAQIADVLQSRGWYLQILDANSVTRGLRNSPPMKLWYTDGGSIQKITLSSIDVQ